MTVNDFLSAVAEIKALSPKYRQGHTGDDGYCDCIGLVIGAVERCGEKWDGVHGSNWWARHYTHSLMRVTAADELLMGDLVYKAKGPGASGYDLPNRYKDDPDRLDYYHVGVVTGVEPLEITHCTKSSTVDGITTDPKLGSWTYRGRLTLLDDVGESEGETMGTVATVGTMATVHADNGKPVNFRRKPSMSGALIDRVPVGRQVTVLSRDEGWAKVVVGSVMGYMMEKYLQFDDGDDAASSDQTSDKLAVCMEHIAALEERVAMLEERVAALEGGVG